MNRKSYLALALFGLLHVGAIPLMSAYGLQVCPILKTEGFLAGCHSLAIILGLTFVIDLTLIWVIRSRNPKGLLGIYFISCVLSSIIGGVFFGLDGILLGSRVIEVLLLMALLIGSFQSYLARWLIPTASMSDFERGWRRTVAAGLLPALMVAVFNVHYLLRLVDHNPQVIFLTLMTLNAWMVSVYVLHFVTENQRARTLQTGLEALKRGQWEQKITAQLGGVWGPLGQLLNETSTALLERSRLLSGMSRFVSREVAEKVREGTLDFSGKTMNLTVLMMDIRDFTVTSQTLTGQQLVQFLNVYFEEVLKIFIRHNVVVDKFIGDGILAYVEPGKGDEVERAYRASREVIQHLPAINAQLVAHNLPAINLGIGITRGEVILGNIGGEERWQYTIIGNTVNRAARLEALTKKLKCRLVLDLDAYTHLPASSLAELQDAGSHSLSGFSNEFSIRSLT
jgi:class 3 adenylate cyclase